ncbi:MAG: amidohydrolase family protein [Armatimonadota bacterium]
MTKIDMHAHYGVWNFPIPEAGTAENLLRLCDRHDVEYAVCSSAEAILYDMEAGNEAMAEVCAEHERLLGYVYVNPNFIERSVRQMEQYLPEDDFVGVKIYTNGYTKVPADAECFRDLFGEIARLSTVVLVHTGSAATVATLAEYAQMYPDLNIILGHAAARESDKAAQYAAKHSNMYLEFCSSWAGYGKVERAVNICGAGQIVYGSDMDLIDPAFVIGMYEDADLTDDERAMIYRENAASLLGLQ